MVGSFRELGESEFKGTRRFHFLYSRLKGTDHSIGNFFVFSELLIWLTGKYFLRFSLYEDVGDDTLAETLTLVLNLF